MKRLVLVARVVVLAGCGGSGEETVDARIALVVPDNNIREEGIECAGARPFQPRPCGHAVTGSRTGDGSVVAEGELPAGKAANADPSIDWNSERIPTVCVMTFDVELPERPRYRLVIEGSVPTPFRGASSARERRSGCSSSAARAGRAACT